MTKAGDDKKWVAMTVDDERFDQMLYKRLIDRTGLFSQIITAQTVPQAFDALKNPDLPTPDVIFLDINMPGISGFDFLDMVPDQLGPQLQDVPVVMLTTSLDPRDRERASQYPMVRQFLSKPLTQDDLLGVVALLE
ncbi:response regulator [Tropicibacter naphthalenivorans]|uniref:Sensory/regulatory protein RpfC n=1 Tax=Tropicibacter naphthalenivorans TaxID=441103 RepID=A0A0P1GDN1_9RHOB|nr:response regulator [Tropicibacter naphthalenivorans]CUH74678.1 Sensory/regulatory protein RpfC [Tropicibacter naphthalenivorans]SMC49875.1 Response regulator receiver domain-containing protein [Tropicibacter naphthalenivorans]